MTGIVVDNELLQGAVSAMPQDALTSVRQQAAQQFLVEGFPTVRHEDWKYTNLSAVAKLSNAWLADAATGDEPAGTSAAAHEYRQSLLASVEAHWIVVDGRYAPLDIPPSLATEKGVTITRLSDELPASGLHMEDPLTQFNAALLQDGLRISVAPGAVLQKPLGLMIVNDSERDPSVGQRRILVEVGENARAQVVQAYWSDAGYAGFTNSVTELDVMQAAEVDWLQLQECGDLHKLVTTLSARLHADARFNHNAFDLGGSLARNNVAVDISGAGAAVNLYGLYLAREHQHIDNHTRVDHRVGPAQSNEVYRGILGKQSRCVFNGKAVVHAGADGTDASQENHNLLLSGQAEIDTKPELEIYADDVKCAHGATVGELDSAALYYLRTRGLSRDEAAVLLTRSFAASILSGLSIEACRDYVSGRIDTRLDQIISDSSREED